MRVLFVCLGNICRSPAAEAILCHKAAEAGLAVDIDSAGTGDWHVGRPPHPPMIEAALRRGYDLGALRARQVTPEDFNRYDLILAADPENRADLEALRPRGNDTPVRLLAAYAEGAGDTVPDPYMSGDYEAALDLVERACAGLVAQLQ